MRSLSVALLVLLMAAISSPGLAQEPSETQPSQPVQAAEEKPAKTPEMRDGERIELCRARANQPLEPSDVEPIQIGPMNKLESIHTPWPRFRRNTQRGSAIVEAIIDEDGCVREAKILRGDQKKLDAAALEAVKQWVYKPAQVDGKPVRVRHFVSINYSGSRR